MPSGVISGIRPATTLALYSMCTAAMLRPSTPTWATIVLRLFLPIVRKACCCSVARQILARGTFKICWCKQKMAKRGRSTRLLRGVRSPGTRRAIAALWWVRPIPRNCASSALCAPACRFWCPGWAPRVATWRRLQRRGWMNTVNGPLLQFRVPSYMPAMIVIMLLLNMRRGRCATGSMRRGEGMSLKAEPELQVDLAPHRKGGLRLHNPVMIASGPFGYTMEKIAGVQQLGAVVCKGTTLLPRGGNAHPRTVETASGMLNAIGLENPGIRVVVERYAPVWAAWQMPVIVNIAGEEIDEFVSLAEQLEGVPGIAGIEVNVSCPNVRAGGAIFGNNPRVVADVTAAVRRVTTLPVIVKLSPNASDLRPIALAAASSGADAVSLINTITSMSIDIHACRPTLAHGTGGLSGPAIKPIALRMVYEVACELRSLYPQVPVIGIGGITTARDALEFLMAGASAIEIGTVNLANPRAGVEILEGIEEFLCKEGITDVAEIVGTALL